MPRNALIPNRTSCRAKRCPHISTRKCVSAERDALSLPAVSSPSIAVIPRPHAIDLTARAVDRWPSAVSYL